MKKNLSIILAICLLGIGLHAKLQKDNKMTTNFYVTQWEKVEEINNKDLPKSAQEEVNKILQQAVADGNVQQAIKASFYKNKYELEINDQDNTQIFSDFENLLAKTTNETDKSILNYILGDLYLKYYQAFRWEIQARTNLFDYVPEDMREWSQNIFFDKAVAHFNASLENKNGLQAISIDLYKDILILNDDSMNVYTTLFDFIASKCIVSIEGLPNENLFATLSNNPDLLKEIANTSTFPSVQLDTNDKYNQFTALRYYQQLLSSLKDNTSTSAIIVTQLSKTNYLSTIYYPYQEKYYLSTLLELQKEYETNPTSVEIINQLVSYYINKSYNSVEYKADAYNWCKKGITDFPNYKRIGILESQLASIEAPYARINGESTLYPELKNKTLTLIYKNLNKITINIEKKDANDKFAFYTKVELELPNPPMTFSEQTQKIELPLNEIGVYQISILFDKKANKSEKKIINISNIAVFCKALSANEYEFYIVNRQTGAPIKNATISILKGGKDITSKQTDNKGFATYIANENFTDYSIRAQYEYQISDGNDKPNTKNEFPYNYRFNNGGNSSKDSQTEIINLLTDRSIYRPGQVVYFKVIASQTENNQPNLIVGKNYTVKLYDTNGQLVSEQTLKTNEFGSISGQFVLPLKGNTGTYSIVTGAKYYTEYIRVEEYKRPTFHITFDPLTKAYTFGDKITISGHAESFSGIKLQDAKVEYNITKSSFWRMSGGNNSVENGTVKTNADGLFEITFTIPKEKNKSNYFWRNISRFNINATVTDQNGETQSGNFYFSAGDVSIILSATLPAKIEKENEGNFSIKATNLNGQEMDIKGTYQLSKVDGNDTISVLKGNFDSGVQEQLMREIKKQKSGKYLLKLNAKDENERTVENENEFVLYSISDKKPPIETNEWIIEKNKTFSSTQPAEIILGVSAKNATILYELLQGNKTLDRQQIKFSDENKKFVVPYKEEYGDRIDMVFTYMIDNRVYQRVVNIKKEQVANKLNLKFDVFRDKVRPGQHEEWRISVKDKKDNPVVAELLASMYDVSLDEIYPTSNWRFDTGIYPDYVYPLLFGVTNNQLYDYFYFDGKEFKYPALNQEQLNLFGFQFNRDEAIIVWYGKQRKAVLTGSVANADVLYENAVEYKAKSISADNADLDAGSVTPAPLPKSDDNSLQIRKNFDETAFFYPNLKTNERGETVISFTVPESNTTWKFRALAYDKGLAWGTLEKNIVSRKELMVTPNLPRFMRQGDKTSISTKVSNLSENQLSGTVRIEFFDAITDKIVDWKTSNNRQSFTLDKDASTSVEWMFDIPSDIGMIGCRIVAESDYFSDGEQHVIPILPNRMLVTESLPLNVNGIGNRSFVFNSLKNNQSSSLSNYRLTLEYTSNPAWYAIQALPEFSNPTNENAVNWFASYYVNTLGAHIMKQYPTVANMIDAWKKQGETEETITSKLLKNEELKTVLLQETPWVLDARDEAEQMQRIALLLNINNTKQQTQEAIQKLKDLQNSDGGWSWYKGFSSNRSITQYILYGFTQLIELNAVEYTSEVKEMQMAALQFIDKQFLKDFESLKKHDKNWAQIKSISTNQLEYLYVRSAYRDIPISQETREAERFYTSIVEKNWKDLNLYERSLLVILSKRNGNKVLAENLIQSLRERATISNELGMYWANNKSRVFLSLSAVSTHVFIMNAFNEMGADAKEMNLMKQWLISQKQTQVWESTHASIDAIYGLLSTGSNWFTADSDNSIQVKIGGGNVMPSKQELGTGYFEITFGASNINKSMANIQVVNKEDRPSYGAVYWQYFESLDKITAQKGGELSIDKKLFVEKLINNQKQLVQITESNPLNVGDKVIVKLTVNTDRDMEFVALKDMRAACFEPIETLSFTRWNMGTLYYQSTRDASTNYYFDYLMKGTYVFEYPVYVNRAGEYSNGITTIQCLYAPEFVSHTAGIKVTVK